MAQQLEGGLTLEQRNSLEIEEFIFHIIDPEIESDEKVIFLDEVQLQQKQKTFFLDRLREISEGTQYIFKPDSVTLKEKCDQAIEQRDNFVLVSRQIATDFSGRHSGQMSAGIFIVSIVKYLKSANNWGFLTLLLKMDKQSSFSYSYREENGRRIAVVEEIENSLNENKAAIQKSALIDVSNHFAWQVLAFDRVKKPQLGDYFKAFLGVEERHQDSQLTRMAHVTVKRWAKKLSVEDIPENEDATTYAGRSLNYLSDHDVFSTPEFLDAVVRDEDPDRKSTLMASLNVELTEVGVSGQQFRPKPGSIPGKDRKQIYETIEGVTIVYEGDQTAAGIKVVDLGDGRKRLTIETNGLRIK